MLVEARDAEDVGLGTMFGGQPRPHAQVRLVPVAVTPANRFKVTLMLRPNSASVKATRRLINRLGKRSTNDLRRFTIAASNAHLWLHRLTKGKIRRLKMGSAFFGILTTVGRRSGEDRSVPLLVLPSDNNFAVVGSFAGLDQEQAWSLNLRASPRARLEVDGNVLEVLASVVEEESERSKLWSAMVDSYPGFVDHQDRTEREFPIYLLTPTERST